MKALEEMRMEGFEDLKSPYHTIRFFNDLGFS